MRLRSPVFWPIVFIGLFFAACTDYVEQIDDQLDEYYAHSRAQSESMIEPSNIQVNPADVVEGVFFDMRDGQMYRMVTIGSQAWMAENLNYNAPGSYCYNDVDTNCAMYGRLYTWAAAMDSAGVYSVSAKDCGKGKVCAPEYPVRGACPEGWHLPSYGEWESLITAVDTMGDSRYTTAAYMLGAKSGWSNNSSAWDYFKFSAIPAGAKTINGKYYYEGSRAYFWSSSEGANTDAYRYILNLGGESNVSTDDKSYGFSIRCINNVARTTDVAGNSDTDSSSSQLPESGSPQINYGKLTDYRDGQEYKTVVIGSQIWMAENLKYDIDSISFCFKEDAAYCVKYGRLYTWSAAMEACPIGWHLPTADEFETLMMATGRESMAGTNLKSTSGWTEYEDMVVNGTNIYGFNALPSGFYRDGEFVGEGTSTYFWSSTVDDEDDTYPEQLWLNRYEYDNIYIESTNDRNSGLSVRCIKSRRTDLSDSPLDSGFLWHGPDDSEGRVMTGYEDENGTSGYWYDYNDADEGGSSAVLYPSEIEKNDYDNFFGPLVEAYGGLKGTVSFGEGSEYPYAGLAFNIGGEERPGVDIVDWNGICLSYVSNIAFSIEIVSENEAFATKYTNNYRVTVPKSAEFYPKDFSWAKFRQGPDNVSPKNLEEVLSRAAVVRLNFEGAAGIAEDFLIQSIGSLGRCTETLKN